MNLSAHGNENGKPDENAFANLVSVKNQWNDDKDIDQDGLNVPHSFSYIL